MSGFRCTGCGVAAPADETGWEIAFRAGAWVPHCPECRPVAAIDAAPATPQEDRAGEFTALLCIDRDLMPAVAIMVPPAGLVTISIAEARRVKRAIDRVLQAHDHHVVGVPA